MLTIQKCTFFDILFSSLILTFFKLGGLASYNPTFLDSQQNLFKLGISRAVKSEEKVNTVCEPEDTCDMIKPADSSEISSWSTSSTASDLLF